MKTIDYLIIGAGLAGGVLARCLADDGKSVRIIERRNHIAGNLYDYDEDGIKIQKYGPHVFHTNDDRVYEFISRFCETVDYKTKCEAVIDGISSPSPFNFKTIEQFYSTEEAKVLIEKLLAYYEGRTFVTVVEMLECDDDLIRSYAEFLFEKDYKLYTAKQWNLNPSEIDASVLKRVPILLSYRDTYFEDKYEFMPKDGFANFYNKLIDSPFIEALTRVEALEHICFTEDKIIYDGCDVQIIYTGAIDELFKYRFGVLPYRSLWFDFQRYEKKSFQNVAIVAYPQEQGFTRITEYTKMPYQNSNHTVVAVEYPQKYDKTSERGNEPYYPVLTDESKARYEQYREYSQKFKNLLLCGRLADFKYYNMDQVILRALNIYDEIKESNK